VVDRIFSPLSGFFALPANSTPFARIYPSHRCSSYIWLSRLLFFGNPSRRFFIFTPLGHFLFGDLPVSVAVRRGAVRFLISRFLRPSASVSRDSRWLPSASASSLRPLSSDLFFSLFLHALSFFRCRFVSPNRPPSLFFFTAFLFSPARSRGRLGLQPGRW